MECHYTTGGYDIFIKIYARNNHHLVTLIHDKLQPLGLARSETIISFCEAIKRQLPVPNIFDKDQVKDSIDDDLDFTDEDYSAEP